MPNTKSFITLMTVLFSIAALCSFAAAADSAKAAGSQAIQWQPYESGIKAVTDQKKKCFLHFYTDWCHYCKVMSKNTFTDPKIIAYLNENFVNIRVNADQEKEVAELFRVKPVPDNWFINDDGKPLSHQPGYIPPDMFLNMLKFVHTDSFKTMKFSDFIKQQETPAVPAKPSAQKK